MNLARKGHEDVVPSQMELFFSDTVSLSASTSLVSGVTSGNFAVAYTYEPGRNAITSLENQVGAPTMSAYTYTNNALDQCTARGQSGSAFSGSTTESFAYNGKGEVDPGTSAVSTYGFDGKMLSDGAGKSLVWDGENRLIEVRDASNNLIATYAYDGQSRQLKKVTTALAQQGAGEQVYLYDGWNRIATYQPSTSKLQLVATATWGRDLSGSREGAGGVGGLLGGKGGVSSCRVSYDANGNVSELLDNGGSVVGHYEYDPFEEEGGLNLYAACRNDLANRTDYLGLDL